MVCLLIKLNKKDKEIMAKVNVKYEEYLKKTETEENSGLDCGFYV